MVRRLPLVAALVCLAFVVYVTVAKQAARPHFVGLDEPYIVVAIERVCAYCALGFLLALAIQGRTLLLLSIILAAAILPEMLQALQPDRDPSVFDALQKVAGGIMGFGLGRFVNTAFLALRAKLEKPR